MPSWNWDESASESGVVHESTANTDHNDASVLKQGYPAAAPILSNGLVMYTPLQEASGSTIHDFSGNNNDGSYNGPTLSQYDLLGATYPSWDGADDEGVMGNPSVIGFSDTDAFSISFWIDCTGQNSAAVTKRDPANGFIGYGAYIVNSASKEIVWLLDSGSNFIRARSSTQISDNGLHALTLTYDGSGNASGLTVYTDGSDDTTGRDDDDISSGVSSNADLHYGLRPDGSADLDGSLAQVMIHNRELSATEAATYHDVVATAGSWTSTTKTL